MRTRNQETTQDVRRRATVATGWWARFRILCLLAAATAITATAQTFTDLVNFDGTNGNIPVGNLVQGTDGNLYGATAFGGTNFGGTGNLFKVTPTGTLTVLYNFCSQTNCTDGGLPSSGLVLATDGNFYGTTEAGGTTTIPQCPLYPSFGCGTVFKITPGGTLTTLYNWCSQPDCTDGFYFLTWPGGGALVQGADGNFYGTTGAGGANNNSQCITVAFGYPGCGTVFKITPEGALTTLYSFCAQTNCTDGDTPLTGLVQGTDGNLYGRTDFGGAYGCGTVFKVTPAGTLTTLHSFDLGENPCEFTPFFPLVAASNGNLYGVNDFGGANCLPQEGCGIFFEITPRGKFTILYNFCPGVADLRQSHCTDGAFPHVLTQGTDGNFNGATGYGGANNLGTFFKITPEGTLTTLYNLEPGQVAPFSAAGPEGLAQATTGTFYGTMYESGTTGGACGSLGCGTVFSLAVGLGPFVETVPIAGKVGLPVTILGTDLTGATSVRFNGKEAAFTVVSATEITATVPADAHTGFVTVHTPSGTLKSNVKFRVQP